MILDEERRSPQTDGPGNLSRDFWREGLDRSLWDLEGSELGN
jgi:hypothetical protein